MKIQVIVNNTNEISFMRPISQLELDYVLPSNWENQLSGHEIDSVFCRHTMKEWLFENGNAP